MLRKFILAAFVMMAIGQTALADDVKVYVYQDASLPLYSEALDLMMAGKYAEAATKFEALIINFPNSSKVAYSAYNLGLCWEKVGSVKKAFEQYHTVLNTYPSFPLSRSVLVRSVNLATILRQKDEDVYDQFLRNVTRRVSSDRSRRYSAIRMAEMGNWSGVDLLIEGLENGSTIEQLRISNLLARRMDLGKVQEAMTRTLADSRNELVRLKALRSLSRFAPRADIKKILVKAMLEDRSEMVRSSAAIVLTRFIAEKDIEAAFIQLVSEEKSPPVLQSVVERIDPEKIKKPMVARLSGENDPMMKLVITGALEHRSAVDEDVEVVLEKLTESPEVQVRMNALRVLGSKSEEPEIRQIFIRRLKEDPDINVKYIAINAIGKHVDNKDVREALVSTMRTVNNIGLVTISISALSDLVEVPEVRDEFIVVLKDIPNPVVGTQLVGVLTKEIEVPEVRNVFFDLLQSPISPNVKIAVAEAFERNTGEANFEDFKILYLKEVNKAVADKYYEVLYRINPVAAKTIKKKKE